MSVTRYGINPQGMLTNLTDGGYVSYLDYAALEARCAALAAELKQSQIDAGCYKNGMEASNERLVQLAAENAGLKEYLAPVGLTVEGTPATDTFLAEVRAQARNELVDELEARFKELSETSPTTELRSCTASAAGFVSTFRKGVQS